jgi:molybdopterin-guanine dinucleotide biosynthesis protein B
MLTDPEVPDDEPAEIPVLSVVGAKGAGKTFVIERLVPELRRRGYRIAVLKHDVHGFEIDREGTDTYRIAQAGAEIVAIAGPGRTAVIERSDGATPLADLLQWMSGVNLVILEGYSQEDYPKVEVRRRGVPSNRPLPVDPVLAVVTDEPDGTGPSSFSFEDIPALADRLISVLIRPRT